MARMKTYAQVRQDVVATLYFWIVRPSNRVFVDVGALDGIRFSNTRRFFELGWSGLCLEAASAPYDALESLYRGSSVITEHVAVSDRAGMVALHAVSHRASDGGLSGASTVVADQRNVWRDYEWHTEDVWGDKLDCILARNNLTAIDLLSVDVEGAEVRVLDGFDLGLYKPALVIIEKTDLRNDWTDAIMERVSRHGYRVWFDNGQDLFLTRVTGLQWKALAALGGFLRTRGGHLALRLLASRQ